MFVSPPRDAQEKCNYGFKAVTKNQHVPFSRKEKLGNSSEALFGPSESSETT